MYGDCKSASHGHLFTASEEGQPDNDDGTNDSGSNPEQLDKT